jgi:hypothetical protein
MSREDACFRFNLPFETFKAFKERGTGILIRTDTTAFSEQGITGKNIIPNLITDTS